MSSLKLKRSFQTVKTLLCLTRHDIPEKRLTTFPCIFMSLQFSTHSTNLSRNKLTPKEWVTSFKLPEPELDWSFLLDERNIHAISENIEHRKGVGDIEKVRALWEEYSREHDESKKEYLKAALEAEALDVPNMSHPDTIIGDESQAKQINSPPQIKAFESKPRNVNEIGGKGLKMLREENLTFATGAKTYYLEADLARLERALVRFSLEKLMAKGFEMVSVPDLLHSGVINSCGFKTSGERSQVYQLHPDCLEGACLAGTAEMSLAGYSMNEVIPLQDLPRKMVAVSRCYRAEAAEKAAEKGLYRVHHFTKVEMFGLTACEDGTESEQLLEEFLAIEKELYSDLDLHFRILDMPSQELGAPAHKKYDVEAWMYGKQLWGEISSCSNCTDFQSRRLNIKYESTSGQQKHVHTVNGTVCAVPRMITALLEQNQTLKRKIVLPEVLKPYMGEKNTLTATAKSAPTTFIKTLRRTEEQKR